MRAAATCVFVPACLVLAACGVEDARLDGRKVIAATPGAATDGVATDAVATENLAGTVPVKVLRVESTAFKDGGEIPAKYSMHGGNVSPPLSWSAVGKRTSCYAIVVDEPGAPLGTWVHWIVWNIPVTKLEENATKNPPSGAVQGRNSWERRGWGGPQPVGGTHRYVFNVYALDTLLDLPKDASRADLDAAMQGHQTASGQLAGTFSAKK